MLQNDPMFIDKQSIANGTHISYRYPSNSLAIANSILAEFAIDQPRYWALIPEPVILSILNFLWDKIDRGKKRSKRIKGSTFTHKAIDGRISRTYHNRQYVPQLSATVAGGRLYVMFQGNEVVNEALIFDGQSHRSAIRVTKNRREVIELR